MQRMQSACDKVIEKPWSSLECIIYHMDNHKVGVLTIMDWDLELTPTFVGLGLIRKVSQRGIKLWV